MLLALLGSYIALGMLGWAAETPDGGMSGSAIWGRLLGCFLLSFLIAMVAVIGGIGGGVLFTPFMLAITQHAGANWPRIHEANDRLWVDWIDTASDMTWTKEHCSGVWDPIQVEAYESTEERDYHIRGKIRMQVLE